MPVAVQVVLYVCNACGSTSYSMYRITSHRKQRTSWLTGKQWPGYLPGSPLWDGIVVPMYYFHRPAKTTHSHQKHFSTNYINYFLRTASSAAGWSFTYVQTFCCTACPVHKKLKVTKRGKAWSLTIPFSVVFNTTKYKRKKIPIFPDLNDHVLRSRQLNRGGMFYLFLRMMVCSEKWKQRETYLVCLSVIIEK